jgi:hypothetical protein
MNLGNFKLNQKIYNILEKNRWVRVFEVIVFIAFSALLGWAIFPTQKTLANLGWYILASILILVNAFYAAIKYTEDIYEIKNFQDARRYFLIVFFGFKLPTAKVSGGKWKLGEKSDSLERIGGPGIFQIERDNVVVVETLRFYNDVLVAGERKLTRYDLVKDVFSTEEQYENIDEIEALTADGIRVNLKNVQFRFRIDGFFLPNAKGRPTVAYLPSKLAVKDLAYNRPIPGDGKLAFWTGAVKGKVTGIIRGHINNAYLDDLISPRETDHLSLVKLREKIESDATKNDFKKMGIRFDSCDIGEICVPDIDVDKEHLRILFVRQSGAIDVMRAQSDSESFASQERGRAEGQAMLLQGIARALQEIGVDGKDPAAVRKNLRNILLTRTAQILESRTSIYKANHKEHNENDHKAKL